ncbi:hypothetical protein LTR28_000004 [Elasticomyces elasticus]|nr:hypothetical protein LTR28_000004 [Elasticomyces elasticus]
MDDVLRADSEASIDAPYRYPIVPTFQDWKFPLTLPDTFTRAVSPERACYTAAQSTVSSAVRARDTTCRISTHHTGTEAAHLCPEHEKEWFLRNSMQRWNSDLSLDSAKLLWDMSNLMLLRSDLHTAFDDRKFAFFPKSNDGFFVHMLEPTPDITPLYHNVRVHDLWQCSLQFLYTRFAWAIFPSLSGFLSKPNTTRLLLVTKEETGRTRWVEVEENTSTRLQGKVAASRSQSPKKRNRANEPKDYDWDAFEKEGVHSVKRQKFTASAQDTASVQDTEDKSDREASLDSGFNRSSDRVLLDNDNQTSSTSFSHTSDSVRPTAAAMPQTPSTSQEMNSDEGTHADSEKNAFAEQDEDALASAELEEDLEFQRTWFPDFEQHTEHQKPISWYPGWRRVERLKRRWMERTISER